MINYWKNTLPLTFGILLSVISIVFIIEGIRVIDLFYLELEYIFEALTYILIGIFFGVIGIPMSIHGISALDKTSL